MNSMDRIRLSVLARQQGISWKRLLTQLRALEVKAGRSIIYQRAKGAHHFVDLAFLRQVNEYRRGSLIEDRVAELEREVADLRRELLALKLAPAREDQSCRTLPEAANTHKG